MKVFSDLSLDNKSFLVIAQMKQQTLMLKEWKRKAKKLRASGLSSVQVCLLPVSRNNADPKDWPALAKMFH